MIYNKLRQILLAMVLLISIANSKTIEYIDEDSFNYIDINPFIGVEAGFAYMKNASSFDSTIESYAYYVGLPIRQYEIILKKKFRDSKDFEIETKSIILNIPINGSGTNLFYIGAIGGKAKVRWDNKEVARFSLQKQTIQENFYGLHVGNKYKFHRNFYVKIELEYIRYNIEDKDLPSDVYVDKSLEFIYGIEYRF